MTSTLLGLSRQPALRRALERNRGLEFQLPLSSERGNRDKMWERGLFHHKAGHVPHQQDKLSGCRGGTKSLKMLALHLQTSFVQRLIFSMMVTPTIAQVY